MREIHGRYAGDTREICGRYRASRSSVASSMLSGSAGASGLGLGLGSGPRVQEGLGLGSGSVRWLSPGHECRKGAHAARPRAASSISRPRSRITSSASCTFEGRLALHAGAAPGSGGPG